jgi:hypothetical protein
MSVRRGAGQQRRSGFIRRRRCTMDCAHGDGAGGLQPRHWAPRAVERCRDGGVRAMGLRGVQKKRDMAIGLIDRSCPRGARIGQRLGGARGRRGNDEDRSRECVG